LKRGLACVDLDAELDTHRDYKVIIVLIFELHVCCNVLSATADWIVRQCAEDDFDITISRSTVGLAGAGEDDIHIFVPLRTANEVQNLVAGGAEVERVRCRLDIDVCKENVAAVRVDNVRVDVEVELLGADSVVALGKVSCIDGVPVGTVELEW